MPSKQAITEFKELYKNRYGITLTDQEAFEKGNSLLQLYTTILKPTMNMQNNHDKEIHSKKNTK